MMKLFFYLLMMASTAAALHPQNGTNKNEEHLTSGCGSDADCESYETCVYVNSGWSQCIACDDSFQYSCEYWSEDTLVAAEKACQMNCPGTQCSESAPCYGSNVTCVSKSDDTWAQCVDCDPDTFQNDCVGWDTPMREAAVEECQVNCLNTMCTPTTNATSSGMPCVDGFTCVVQADSNWAQCVDCDDTASFMSDCYSWTEKFKTAAEEACGLTCP